jgi:helix-turn-helix protein
MGKSTLADFSGAFASETAGWEGPREGRVLLGEHQLVLAASRDEKVTVPLQSVFDINFDSRPQIFDPLPGTPLTIAFEDDGGRSVAVIGSEESTARKFHTVLFKAVLNGSDVTIKHPARRGGRVTGMPFHSGELALAQGGVRFVTGGITVQIEPSSVTAFDREMRRVESEQRPVFVVRHMQDGTAVTTLAATDSARMLSLLGRYLRRHYDRLISSLEGVSLSETGIEALVTVYSASGGLSILAGVLDARPKEVKRLVQSLRRDGLLEPTEDGPALTTRGQVVVNHYVDRVNE